MERSFPGHSVVKNPPANAGDMGSVPDSEDRTCLGAIKPECYNYSRAHGPQEKPLQCHISRVRLFVTPWTVVHQAPLSTGFSGREYWRGLPCPPPGDLLDPRTETAPFTSPASAGGLATISSTWKAPVRSLHTTIRE